MTVDPQEMRHALIAAVQAELQRHAKSVNADLQRVARAGEESRRKLHEEMTATIASLRDELDAVKTENTELRGALADRVSKVERKADDTIELVDAKVTGLVEAAAKPMIQVVRDEQDDLGRRVEHLDKNLRKFDEQAARMVSYFNELTEALETRSKQARAELREEVGNQIEELDSRVAEEHEAAKQFQQETTRYLGQKLGDLEDRMVDRIVATEGRITADVGERIAEIDAHVGRVGSGLDETLSVVTDRLNGLDTRGDAVDEQLGRFQEALAAVDVEGIEELKEKLSTAAGEAVLIRIDLEKLEKSAGERFDTHGVRLTDLESQLAEQTMDVSTAVQLDRLEELERAVIQLGGPGTRPLGSADEYDDLDDGMPTMPSSDPAPAPETASSGSSSETASSGSSSEPVSSGSTPPPPPPTGGPTVSAPPPPPAPSAAPSPDPAGID